MQPFYAMVLVMPSRPVPDAEERGKVIRYLSKYEPFAQGFS